MRVNWREQWRLRGLWIYLFTKALGKGPRRFWRWLTHDVPWILDEDR